MSDTILIVDDKRANRNILAQELAHQGYAVETAANGAEALEKTASLRPDLIILDYMMPDLSGIDVLKKLRQREENTPVVMVTAYGTVEKAVEAMKEGAYDFITRPFEADHVTMVVQKALDRQRLETEVGFLAEEVEARYRLILGENTGMKQATELARKAADSAATVLLLGESGTGKEIFARNIHSWGKRKQRPFVAINSVGLSQELLESELFGHERGAFTGAHELKKGKVELAHRGTVFLDEIGDISPELQSKLLRFIEEREFERVGGTKPVSVDIRVIAATNRDLESLINDRAFREDLYHRLNVVTITLPPLRERKEDIPVLANYFLSKYAIRAGKRFTGLTEEVVEKLLSYHWPGNVRELANVIERAIVLGSGPSVTLEDLPHRLAPREQPGRLGVEETVAAHTAFSYRQGMNAARTQLIAKALSKTEGNRSAAAKLLGLEPKYLLKLIKSLGIE